MNYRHAFHAGNFADVAKHLALVAALLHLRKKDKPFFVLDTHGGCGRYDLAGDAAQRTGEAEAGIERLRGLEGPAGLPEALATYLDIACAEAGHYPGSPLIAAKMLRGQDRLVAIEKHPEDAIALRSVLKPYANADVETGDGYDRLAKLLPPKERRGLVLIDPPYEVPDEFETAAHALTAAWRRFATSIYMLWFPIKSKPAADAFCGEVLAAGVTKALRIDIGIGSVPPGDKARLTAAGLLLVNPPYGLDEAMREAAQILTPRLEAQLELRWLAGEGA